MNVEIYNGVFDKAKANETLLINDFERTLESLEDTLNSMSKYWKGSDYDYFKESMDPFLGDLKHLYDSVETYCDFIVYGYHDAYLDLLTDFQSDITIDLK